MALDYYRSQGKIQGHAITNLQIKLLLVKLLLVKLLLVKLLLVKLLLVKLLLINNPHGKTINILI